MTKQLIRSAFFAFLVLFCSWTAFATAQYPDRLIYLSADRDLFTNPLESYYKDASKERPQFMIKPFTMSSANWRGYIATWEIADDKLYLNKVESWLCDGATTKDECKQVQLVVLFSDKVISGRVLADWFSGELRVLDGKQIMYVHMGYGSVYERDLIFQVANGVVTGPRIIDNTKNVPASPNEIARKELEVLKNSSLGDQPAFGISPKVQAPTTKEQRTPASTPLIVPGQGVFTFGAARSEIEALIGNGEAKSPSKEVYFVDYPKAGVQVSYVNGKDSVRAIFLYNNQTRYEHFVTPSVRTDKGIDWHSTADDVIKAYGKTSKDFGEDDGSFRRLEYPGIDFLFQGGKLRRIGILPPRDN